MSAPRVMILRTAGTNCDEETDYAWRQAGALTRRVHIRELIERPTLLKEFVILTIPGGFSYGDDISAGRILANQLVHHLSEALKEFIAAGRLVLGICNGFQVLVKAGLLPGPAAGTTEAGHPFQSQTVTLTCNDSARFEARWVHLRTAEQASAFLPAGERLTLPVAHGEGKLVCADDTVRQRLMNGGHVALTYCDEHGRTGGYPINPNGSEADIAGLVDATGRILGLMPHPERHVECTQHPAWTSRPGARPDGRLLFDTAIATARSL